MAVYIYTVKDRETGEELLQGREGACARYLDCSEDYVRTLAKRERAPSKTRFGHVVVERCLEDVPVRCVDCRVVIPNAGPMCKRCPECARRRNLEQARRNRQEHPTVGSTRDISEAQARMQRPCIGCAYFGGENNVNNSCNYIFIEDKRRPCPPGKDCTVKKPKKK